MALHKRVKEGGSYYKGYELIVSATPGNYILDMTQTSAVAINAIRIIPDAYGPGDTYSIKHLAVNTSTTKAILAESIFNAGAGVGDMFDLPAMEMMGTNEPLRLTYTNSAGVSLNVHVIVEYAGIIKQS